VISAHPAKWSPGSDWRQDPNPQLPRLGRRGGIYRIAAMAGAVNSRLLMRIFPQEEIEWEEFSNFGNAERNLVDRGVRLKIW
jgi:hypothetical protein